jgi:hypothetical protein
MTEKDNLLEAIGAVREARLALLQKPGALDELRAVIGRMDDSDARTTMMSMLEDDLRVLREREEQARSGAQDPNAWRRLRCPNCNGHPANELQASQRFCHLCNVFYES